MKTFLKTIYRNQCIDYSNPEISLLVNLSKQLQLAFALYIWHGETIENRSAYIFVNVRGKPNQLTAFKLCWLTQILKDEPYGRGTLVATIKDGVLEKAQHVPSFYFG